MSSSVIGALRANLGLDSAQFSSGAKAARSVSQQLQRDLKLLAGAAAAVGAGIVAMARNAATTIDAQAKLARAVGGTTIGLQALERAGDRAGVSSSELGAATTRLNQVLGRAIVEGKGTEGVFAKIGVSAQALAKMDIDERFAAISDAMRSAGMSTQEMAFHLRALGIRQSSVITLMQGGSEEITRSRQAVIDYGVAVSEVDAAQIERTNDALSEVGRVFEGLRNQIAVALAPAMEMAANAFTSMAREGGIVYNLIRGFVAQLPRLNSYIMAAVGGFTAYRGILLGVAAAKYVVTAASGTLRVALLRLGLPALIIAAGEIIHQFGRLANGAGGFGNALVMLKDVAIEVWERIKMGFAIIPEAIKLGSAKMAEWFSLAIQGMLIAFSTFTWQVAEGLNSLFGSSLTGANFAGAIGGLTDAAQEAGTAAYNAGVNIRGLAAAATAPLKSVQALKDAVNNTKEATDAATDSMVELGDEAEEAGGRGAKAAEKIKEAVDKFAQAANRGGDRIGNMFNSLLDRSKDLKSAIADLIMEIAKMQIMRGFRSLFGAGGAFPGIGAALGNLIGENAKGTNNWRGGLTSIHERGGEIVDLPRGTRIIPNDISKRMADGASNSGGPLHVHVTAAFDESGNLYVKSVSQQAAAEMGAEINRGLPARVQQISARPRVR